MSDNVANSSQPRVDSGASQPPNMFTRNEFHKNILIFDGNIFLLKYFLV